MLMQRTIVASVALLTVGLLTQALRLGKMRINFV
ncbi:MAG: hypothetical protein QOI77_2553 [Blastocatellia bacterium]|nr:hypothetical protein [Blastocatellia bacterium]